MMFQKLGAEYDTGEDLTTSIIKQAIAKEASMIYLENSSDGIKMRFRVGNTVEDGDYIEPEYGRALTLHFKRLAGISIHENELPQSGRTPTSIGNKRIMVSVSSLPTISGETVVIKILEEKPWLKLDNLGFSSKVSTSVTPISSMVSTIIVMWCGLFILSSASMCISLKEIEKHYAEKKKWKVFLYLFYGVIVGFAVASLFVILSHI